jgi:hypothetical protein
MDVKKFYENPNVDHYELNPHPAGGSHLSVFFHNGYGCSVIRHQYSYGGREGLFEIGVLNSEGHLVYDSPVTNDVIGWLTAQDVVAYMNVIASLPTRGHEIEQGEDVRHGSLEQAGEALGEGGQAALEEGR